MSSVEFLDLLIDRRLRSLFNLESDEILAKDRKWEAIERIAQTFDKQATPWRIHRLLTRAAHRRRSDPGRLNQPYLDQLPTLAILAADQRFDLGRILRAEVLEVPL
jgi:hypothetical protein